jgi:hypothetical protein
MAAPGHKRRAPDEQPRFERLEITPHGAGNEVGRSCLVLRFKGKTIMVGRVCLTFTYLEIGLRRCCSWTVV